MSATRSFRRRIMAAAAKEDGWRKPRCIRSRRRMSLNQFLKP
jgi:hypothetical protein